MPMPMSIFDDSDAVCDGAGCASSSSAVPPQAVSASMLTAAVAAMLVVQMDFFISSPSLMFLQAWMA